MNPMNFISYDPEDNDLSSSRDIYALDEIYNRDDAVKLNSLNSLKLNSELEHEFQKSEPHNPFSGLFREASEKSYPNQEAFDFQDPFRLNIPSHFQLSPIQNGVDGSMYEDPNVAIGDLIDNSAEYQPEENLPQLEQSEEQSTQAQSTLPFNDDVVEQILQPINYIMIRDNQSRTVKVSVKPNEKISNLIVRSPSEESAEAEDARAPRRNEAKNFPKKFGDQFCDYLVEMGIRGYNKLFKDKTSWKLLNNYCNGSSKIPGVSRKAFIKFLFDFVREKRIEDLLEGRSEATAKLLHMANFMCLKLACAEIQNSGVEYQAITFKRGFPAAVIECDL